MSNRSLSRTVLSLCLVVAAAVAANTVAQAPARPAERMRSGCDAGNGGISLPPGFCASVFADGIGHARHLTVARNGDVYVNTSSSKHNDFTNAPGPFVVALRDADRDGRAETVERFGSVFQPGKPGGGSGIAIAGDMLYVEVEGRIVRYALGRDGLVPKGGETIVAGMPTDGDHPMHTFAVASDGALYVNSGSASNSCQQENRALESPGKKPCPELPTRAGIWRFDASKTGQTFTAARRFATGARNSVGLALNPADGALFAAVHGRDQLNGNWPKLYTQQQNNELPAETLVRVAQGDDFGWPYCYYDAKQARLVLAPEYGGDGGKSQGECAGKKLPDVAFPAHWAPEAIAFYTGSAFPAKYRGGAFVSFHGSWDRKPVQSGFLVAFVPFAGAKPAGGYEEFATGFAGAQLPADPKKAKYRPMGLAVGPDGALFVSDDVTGRIWRIVANGPV
jgi:glucose/arabinose dehydrogenase